MKLKICWLFPHHLNIYGDRGNILALKYRAEKRGINVEIIEISSRRDEIPDDVNLIFGGGGQDKQQEYVSEELQFFKTRIHELIHEYGVPGLTICGTYQLFGHYFKTFEGKEIRGISIFDAITVASTKRKIGNVVVKLNEGIFADKNLGFSRNGFCGLKYDDLLVGFENHSGNTYLKIPKTPNPNDKQFPIPNSPPAIAFGNSRWRAGKFPNGSNETMEQLNNVFPLGQVMKGFGNNGEDKTEGAIVNNCIGTYLHGPILPKNPRLADWLIGKALMVGQKLNSVPTDGNNFVGGDFYIAPLPQLDDSLELQTREKVIGKILK